MKCMRCYSTQFLSSSYLTTTMNPFLGRKYLAEVNKAGQAWEEQHAKGLAIILEDTNQEVLCMRASIEGHYKAEEGHRADMQQEICSLKSSVKQVLQQQEKLLQVLNGSSTAAIQVAAQGAAQTISRMEAGLLVPQKAVYRAPPPRMGLVGGFLYHLDVWALQLFEKMAVKHEAMPRQCPMSLYRLYKWHRVKDDVPRCYQLSQLCAPPRHKKQGQETVQGLSIGG